MWLSATFHWQGNFKVKNGCNKLNTISGSFLSSFGVIKLNPGDLLYLKFWNCFENFRFPKSHQSNRSQGDADLYLFFHNFYFLFYCYLFRKRLRHIWKMTGQCIKVFIIAFSLIISFCLIADKFTASWKIYLVSFTGN